MSFKKDLKKVWHALEGHQVEFCLFFSLGLPIAAIKSYQAYLIKPIFDKGLSKDTDFESLKVIVFTLLGLSLIHYFFRYFQGKGLRTTSEKIALSLRKKVIGVISKMTLNEYETRSLGAVTSIALDDIRSYSRVIQDLFVVFKEIITIFGYIGILFYHSTSLALCVLLIIPIYILLFKVIGRKSESYGKKSREIYSKISEETLQSLDGRVAIRALGAKEYMIQRSREHSESYVNILKKIFWVQENAGPFTELVGVIILSFLLVLGHSEIQDGAMTTGALLSFLSTMALVIDPVRRMSNSFVIFKTWSASGNRVFDLIDANTEEIKKSDIQFLETIEFKNVKFTRKDNLILDNISFNILKGQKVALVGESGSGKTTFLNLFLGFFDDFKGDVLIDGRKVLNTELRGFRDKISFISQESSLFRGTIKDNILLDNDFQKDRFEKVLYDTDLKSVLPNLENNINTQVGERGSKISGGQRQKVSLARSLYRESEILIMDEATSALDNQSDELVQNTLLKSNRTIIAIAHKLNTIKDYDQIYFFKNGKITEFGNHQDLINQKGDYYFYYSFYSA